MKRIFATLVFLMPIPAVSFGANKSPAPLPQITQPPVIESACRSAQPLDPYCSFEHFECNRGVPVDGLIVCSDYNEDGRIDVQDCIDSVYALCANYGGVHSYG